MAYKIFLDTNIFLDVFLERTSDWQDAETVLQLAAQNRIDVFTSANNLINVTYALRKQKLTQAEVITLMELTLTYVEFADTSKSAFGQALKAGFTDLEDAVQYYTALQIKGVDYFLTSNTKDYKKASVQLPVITATQFIRMYNRK
ncbi:MAG TPA: PIN domain-containing protein [Chitinophagaceae bacterium]|nr:PIN domain-containing protein [Chitinophagaceae bacterium]